MEEYGFEILEVGRCLVAVFRGEISGRRYSEFRNDYNEVCKRLDLTAEKLLIIDLTAAEYFGSLFIGMIVKLTGSVGQQNGTLALCGLSDQLMELMKKLLLLERASNSNGQLKHFATRAEAVAALTSPPKA